VNLPPLALLGDLELAGTGAAGWIVAFLALAIGHALGDFALQGEFLATAKNRTANLDKFFGGAAPPSRFLWIYALSAHSLIHAGAVWAITGSPVLAAAELVLHWLIDFAKGEGWTSFSGDQILHLACKIVYALLIVQGAACVTWTP